MALSESIRDPLLVPLLRTLDVESTRAILGTTNGQRGLGSGGVDVEGRSETPQDTALGSSTPHLPRPDGSRVLVSSSPTRLSIDIPAGSYFGALFASPNYNSGGLLLGMVLFGLTAGIFTALAVWSMSWVAGFWAVITQLPVWFFAAHMVMGASLREHLEVEGGEYVLTRQRTWLEWLGWHCVQKQERRGPVQALRSIEVAVRRKETTDSDGTHVFVTHMVEWRDGGEVVTFGEFLKWDHEKAWLVGEVLAWLQQGAAAGDV